MSVMTQLLRVGYSKEEEKLALKHVLPAMDSGFNINAVRGNISLFGEDARAVRDLLIERLSARVTDSKGTPNPAKPSSVKSSESADLKKALNVLKSVMSFASRDWPKYLGDGEAIFHFDGTRFTYSSLEGATIGVDLPVSIKLAEPVQLTVKMIKSALLASPGKFLVDHEACSINGVKFDPEFRLDPLATPLDVNRQFGSVKTVLEVPLPAELSGVRMAEGFQDVRTYLNGSCFDLGQHAIIATDGHRMHVANSATLPHFDAPVLHQLFPNSSDGQKVILANWQLHLLNAIGATKVSIGRFPAHPKDTPPLNGWRHPQEGSDELLVRAKGAFGFFIGKSIDGRFPDWRRVLHSLDDLERKRVAVRKVSLRIAEQIKEGDQVSDSLLAWKADYPRSVLIGDSVCDSLRRFIRAEKASGQSTRPDPLVILDLKAGQIRSLDDAAVPLKIDLSMQDQFEYSEDRPWDHVVGVQASYLADAIEFLGSAEWFVWKSGNLSARKESLSAVVMPCNL